MRPGPKSLPQPSPLWSTFRPETHRHLVLLWTDLLQLQLPAARGRAHVPGEPCHERHLAQDRAASPAPARCRLRPPVDAAAGPGQSGVAAAALNERSICAKLPYMVSAAIGSSTCTMPT